MVRKLFCLFLTINYLLKFRSRAISSYEANSHDIGFLKVSLRFLEDSLRKFPYWKFGLREYVRGAIIAQEYEKAYGGIKALYALSPTKEVRLVEAKVLLKKNLFERAKKIFIEYPVRELSLDSREDYIAVLLGVDDFSGAKRVIDTIPKEKRSMMQEVMNQYLDRKLVG